MSEPFDNDASKQNTSHGQNDSNGGGTSKMSQQEYEKSILNSVPLNGKLGVATESFKDTVNKKPLKD